MGRRCGMEEKGIGSAGEDGSDGGEGGKGERTDRGCGRLRGLRWRGSGG
uniref:OSJNBb0046K02.7 protein n=1 Tax=Oryza sativa subsp. japonica TaxID=39947 RepID=Q7DNB6_ORYSJ|nr:OSJNBb0046K02.7 [Oryza sativa Japonica Group]